MEKRSMFVGMDVHKESIDISRWPKRGARDGETTDSHINVSR